MVVGLDVVGDERRLAAPHGVDERRVVDVELKARVGVAHAGVESVNVVFVLKDVEVDADASVGRRRLVGGLGDVVGVVGFAVAELDDGEVLVLEVDAHADLVLSVRRDGFLHESYEVGLDLYASEEGYGVVDLLHPQALLFLFRGAVGRPLRADHCCREEQQATDDTP